MPRFFSMPHRCIINVMKNEGDLFPPKKLAGTVVFEVLGDNLLLCCLFSLALFLKDTGSLTWIDSPVSRSRAEAEDCCFQNVKGSRQDDRVSFYSLRTLQGCCWSGFYFIVGSLARKCYLPVDQPVTRESNGSDCICSSSYFSPLNRNQIVRYWWTDLI